MGLLRFGEFDKTKGLREDDKAWMKFDSEHTIVDYCWRGAGKFGTVGFVAVTNSTMDTWACYLGVAEGDDEKTDALAIAQWGSAQPENEALAYFPNMKGKKYKES